MNKKLYTINEANKLSIEEVHKLYNNYINPNQTKIFSSLPFGRETFETAEGVYIYTNNGKKILDFTGGLGVLGLGHNHPRILKARIDYQKEKKVEVHKIFFSKYLAALSSSISSLLPNNLRKSFFLNSGAEAVEAAIKVSFKSYNGKKKNILFSNKSYHGKLIGSGSISGSYKQSNQFPEMNNCHEFNFNDENDLENKIKKINKESDGVYAVIIEPFSASLLKPNSNEFIKKLFYLKNKFDFRIIFDEVYTGFFKSKKMFYFQNYENISPDIICLSKTLGGGKSSISCLVVDEDLYNIAYGKLNDTFLHTTTYNGFGEESITALEALNILSEQNFSERVSEISDFLTFKLNELKEKHSDKIEEIKGTGLLNGIIFKSYLSKISSLINNIPINLIRDKAFFLKKITATAISSELYEKYGILTSINDSIISNHLNVSPSLVIKNEEIEYFFSSISKILDSSLDLKSIGLILNFVKSKI